MMTVKRVAVVVRPMDSITGDPVENGSVHVYMADLAAGIRKNEGYIAFWDNGVMQRRLILESPFYEREEIDLELSAFREKRLPVLNVWMKPGAAYPYSAQVRLNMQKAVPGASVRVLMASSEGVIRLQKSYPADRMEPRQIELLVPIGMAVEGRSLRIRRISDGYEEDFTIWQGCNESAGIYELTEPLQEIYSVYDTTIGILLELRASADGTYLVPAME